jgi:SWIM/SEC-C metal-binding protein
MSDKFFFKGRQDARQNTLRFGYERQASRILGSKKYPLNLLVTTEVRKQEIQAVADEAGLYATINLDTSENAVESIHELEAAMSRSEPVRVVKSPPRNEPCSCGSGKKYKKCCG